MDKHFSWKEKKAKLCNYILSLSDHYGGDSKEWLREYTKALIGENTELDAPLTAFADLAAQDRVEIKNVPTEKFKRFSVVRCACGYVKAFCKC